MKVLVLSLSDKRHMSMIAPYINYFNNKGVQFDIIRTNRYIERDHDYIVKQEHGDIYEINMLIDPSMEKRKKIKHFINFRRKVIRIMKQRSYSFVVVWNENTLALFADYLRNNYKDKYCVNIRDVYSGNRIIELLCNFGIKGSCFSTVPSHSFESILPYRTICLYNKDYNLLDKMGRRSSFKSAKDPITITHLGFYHKSKKSAKELVDSLGNDERYELVFCGKDFDTRFKDYIEERGYKNVQLLGAFDYSKTATLLEKTDIINAYYSMDENPDLNVAFGVKESYIPMLYIPGIVNCNSSFASLTQKYNVAYCLNDNVSTLGDDLYSWYKSLDFVEFKLECDEINAIIDKSIRDVYYLLDNVLNLKTNEK